MSHGSSPTSSAEAAREPASVAPRAGRPTFDELYGEHVDFLWRNARRLGVADDAIDDVLQQVFMVVHRRLSAVVMTGSWRSWLFGVLIRSVRDHNRLLRRKSPHRFSAPTDLDLLMDNRRQPDEALALVEAAAIVQRCLNTLDDDKRQVFILAELEQLSAGEIGEATASKLATVYSRLRAARRDFEAAAARYRAREAKRGLAPLDR